MKKLHFYLDGKICEIIPHEDTKLGMDDGLIHIKDDNSLGNTIISYGEKSNDSRYGASLEKMFGTGWFGFKYLDKQ